MRTILSMAFGIAVWLFLRLHNRMQPEGVVFATEFWIDFSRIVGSQLINFTMHIVPWFLVGITAPRRQLLCGGFSAALASLIYTFTLTPVLSAKFHLAGIFIAIVITAIQFLYGAAGAALGTILGGANNSFKPSPLRGLGRNRAASGGPA